MSSINEVDKSFKEIENLFTAEEREKFEIDNKDWQSSSIFKQYITKFFDEISDETKNNFKKVLKRLTE